MAKVSSTLLKDSLTDLQRRYDDHTARIAFVGYRDLDCKTSLNSEYEGLFLDFVDDVENFSNHLNQIEAFGGNSGLSRIEPFDKYDLCEDIIYGFEKVNTLSWNNFTKLIVHIADYPSHGNKYNGGKPDRYPYLQPDFKSELQKFHNKGIHYHFYKITKHTDKMISEFRKEAPENMVIKESDCFEITNLADTLKFTATFSMAKVADDEMTKGNCGLVDFLGGKNTK